MRYIESITTSRGIRLIQKAAGVEVIFTTGERRYVINTRLTDKAIDQQQIIYAAQRPGDYSK